ncbi:MULTISPECIES: ABC transporter permease subunit [unclassified Streptomyces]|uniref:ABC transporter permease subunit n=1 Tax=unclassified Streptomyces TaxID=2593676 RepID=UPI000CD5B966|nr:MULTISPECIES: ABC transporter permease subunit [unclassified Streptomyces]MCI4040941.1 ABC transporter permease subunit [Streptomyces sp. TRM75563]
MNTAVLTKSLADNRRSFAVWALGTAAVAMAYASTYPSQRDNTATLPEAMREALHIDATAAGYLHASVFGVILPLLAVTYGIAVGTRALAGEEESGRLDLLLAHPVTRTRLALQRFASLVAGAVAISLLVWLALIAIRDSAELTSVTPTEFLAQCLNLALLAITFGAIALAIGAAVGRRAVALAASAAIGVLAYTAHSFAGQVGAGWLAYLSPFHYYIGGEPLNHGFQWADGTVLAAMTSAVITIGVVRFNHRDLT